MKKMNPSVQNLTLAALFLAAGLVLPFLTGQIPQIGSMLLPMHLPVLLCGLVCGWQYGALIGFVLPLLRFALFGMPPIFPTGIAMCFELAAYGFLAGWLWAHSRWKCVKALYACLLPAMRARGLGRGGSHPARAFGQRLHLGRLYRRRAAQRGAGHHPAAALYPGVHGCA